MTFALTGSNIGGEVGEEAVLGDPGEALRVDIDITQRRRRRSLLQQRADRFTFIKAEARDVHKPDDVRCVGAERGDDLASVGVGRKNSRTALAGEHVADPRDVVRKRCLRKLRGGDFVAVGP